jgi:two-component system, LytTR family, response regulator
MQNHTIKTIIVDDEKPSRDALANYISEYCPELEVITTCKSVNEAHKAILEHNPLLVFLDIEMPRGSGFDLLRMFKTIDFNVVFVTAFSDYATRAFRVSATDFLLKPVKVSELVEAVNKVKQNLKFKSYQNLTVLLENLEAPAESIKKLIIPNLKGFTAVNPSDIILCEANGYCTNFFLTGTTKTSSSYHLKYYEEFLPANQFLRVHNSYIINLEHVTGYTHQGEIILTDNYRCPLSKTHKQAFLQRYKNKKRY